MRDAAAVHRLIVGDDPDAWERLGFAVSADGSVPVGEVTLELRGGGGGVRGWVLGGDAGPAAVDGVPTEWAPTPGHPATPPRHPNGASAVDHVVVATASVDRTVDALAGVDGDLRRRAEPPAVPVPMAFVRLGGVVVEVVQATAPTRIWGLVVVVPDVDDLRGRLGDALGEPRPAVQPGRRIVTAKSGPGLETALAFITPRQRR